jgi:hypothetical protein
VKKPESLRLVDALLADDRRDRLVADCVRLVEAHIGKRGGLRGLSLRTALALMRSLRPDALTVAIGQLLPQWAEALEPLYQEFRQSPDEQFSGFLAARSAPASRALVGVIDRRVAISQNKTLKAAYARLRKDAATEMEAALPDLAELLARYIP